MIAYDDLAEKALARAPLSREECRQVLRSPDGEMLRLLDAAYRVRRRFCGDRVHLHVLVNAKSGLCPEDCQYCSQSRVSAAEIEKYPMLSEARLVEGARRAKAARARRYCIVTSGRGPTDREVDSLARVVRSIKGQVDIGICCSVGLLTEEKARRLKEAGVEQLNHNLNTSERYYPAICTTHTYADRMETLKSARRAGLRLCTGAIFGQGESEEDVIDVAMALRELDPQSIPVNFLHPIPGTPLEGVRHLSPYGCLRVLCLMRFLCPSQEIRVSGGREVHLRSLQALALYPANSIFVDGYLTTPGQKAEEAWQMVRDLGFEIQEHHEGAGREPPRHD